MRRMNSFFLLFLVQLLHISRAWLPPNSGYVGYSNLNINDIALHFDLYQDAIDWLHRYIDDTELKRFTPLPAENYPPSRFIVHARNPVLNAYAEFTFERYSDVTIWVNDTTGDMFPLQTNPLVTQDVWLQHVPLQYYLRRRGEHCTSTYHFPTHTHRKPAHMQGLHCFPQFYQHLFTSVISNTEPRVYMYVSDIYDANRNLINWYQRMISTVRLKKREEFLKRVIYDIYIAIRYASEVLHVTCIDIVPEKIIVRADNSSAYYLGLDRCSTGNHFTMLQFPLKPMYGSRELAWPAHKYQTWSFCMTIYKVACSTSVKRDLREIDILEYIRNPNGLRFVTVFGCKTSITRELRDVIDDCLSASPHPNFDFHNISNYEWLKPEFDKPLLYS